METKIQIVFCLDNAYLLHQRCLDKGCNWEAVFYTLGGKYA